jgi:L-asparaginase II
MGFADPPLGIAVKVLDGAERALGPICVAVLEQLGLLTDGIPALLAKHARPATRNHRGVETGAVVAAPLLFRHR